MVRTEPNAPSGVCSSKWRLWLVSALTTDVTERSHMSNNCEFIVHTHTHMNDNCYTVCKINFNCHRENDILAYSVGRLNKKNSHSGPYSTWRKCYYMKQPIPQIQSACPLIIEKKWIQNHNWYLGLRPASLDFFIGRAGLQDSNWRTMEEKQPTDPYSTCKSLSYTIWVHPSWRVLAWMVREQTSFLEEKSTSTFQL